MTHKSIDIDTLSQVTRDIPQLTFVGLTFTPAAWNHARNSKEFLDMVKFTPLIIQNSFDPFFSVAGIAIAVIGTQKEEIIQWTDQEAFDQYVRSYEKNLLERFKENISEIRASAPIPSHPLPKL